MLRTPAIARVGAPIGRARAVLGIVAAMGLAACAPVAWQRPDTSAEQARVDQEECQAIALTQARRLALHDDLLRHWTPFRWRRGHRLFGPDPFESPFLLRRDLERDCLRAKGYRLEPVETD